MSPAPAFSNIHAMTLFRGLLVCCAAVLVVACDRAETRQPEAVAAEQRGDALVRAVHAVPYGSAMDIFAGDLVAFDGVAFKAVTRYRALDGKRYAFAMRPAGMTNAKALSSNTEGLEDGHYYTVFAMPDADRGARLRVVDDARTSPAQGRSRLRIAHAGDGAGRIDVVAGGGTLFDGVAFQDVTNYQDVAPLNGVIDIRPAGGSTAIVTLPNAHLEAGRFYTLVIVGSTQSAAAPEAFIIEDALDPPTTTR